MQELPLNLWAVLGAGAAKFLLGGLWYSKTFFAEPWKKLTGVKGTKAKDGMVSAMILELFGNLLMAFVLAHAIKYAQQGHGLPMGLAGGLAGGFINWLGFVATVQVGTVLFERKPLKLFFINSGFQLISLLVMGAILGIWA